MITMNLFGVFPLNYRRTWCIIWYLGLGCKSDRGKVNLLKQAWQKDSHVVIENSLSL